MSPAVAVHVVGGLLGLGAGAVSLAVLKGGRLHRLSGQLFVWAMLVMSGTGAVMAAFNVERVSVVAGGVTFYLVATSLLTVRRPARGGRGLDAAALLLGLGVAIGGTAVGFLAVANGGTLDGLPAAPAFVFAGLALLGALGDARALLGRPPRGAGRLHRHLWRMCVALLIAAASFFLGQPQVFPEPIRDPAILSLPVLAVLVVTLYWIVRVRFGKLPRPAVAAQRRATTLAARAEP